MRTLTATFELTEPENSKSSNHIRASIRNWNALHGLSHATFEIIEAPAKAQMEILIMRTHTQVFEKAVAVAMLAPLVLGGFILPFPVKYRFHPETTIFSLESDSQNLEHEMRYSMTFLSAIKWDNILRRKTVDLDSRNCASCLVGEAMSPHTDSCEKCPIAIGHGSHGCNNTPYIEWSQHQEREHHDAHTFHVVPGCRECKSLAQAERDMLTKLTHELEKKLEGSFV